MNLSCVHFLFAAALPIAASFAVLTFADVGKSTWVMHVLLIFIACLLAVAGKFLARWAGGTIPTIAIIFLTLIGIAAPLMSESSGPNRWVSLGSLSLYTAPLLLPSFLAACSMCIRNRGRGEVMAFTAMIVVAMLLAIQPDASQALALLAGSTILFMRYRSDILSSTVAVIAMSLITMWAFTRPDPLEPVPYVEGVFILALSRSMWAGLAVIASAFVLVVSLCVYSFRGAAWLAAVAAYYAALFACSVAGLTPAPLIGYGAGPLLGFGLMAAISWWVDPEALPNKSFKPTPLGGLYYD